MIEKALFLCLSPIPYLKNILLQLTDNKPLNYIMKIYSYLNIYSLIEK